MRDGGALHRPFHGARAAAGGHIERAQAQFVADQLGVVVFLARDRVAAPAHHQVGRLQGAQHIGIAQDVKHRVGDARGGGQVEFRVAADFVGGVDHVAQHRKQVLGDALDHLAIDKSARRRALQVELDAALALDDGDGKRLVALEQRLAIVAVTARIEHCQRATAQQSVQTALAGIEQFADFGGGKDFEAPFRRDLGVDNGVFHGA